MKMRFILITLSLLLLNVTAEARRRTRSEEAPSTLTWDIGGAFGSYNGYSYSEIDLGLNYRFTEPWNWRNVAWDRIGNAPVATAGADSSIRYEFGMDTQAGNGVRLFAGPGIRLASSQYTGIFVEGGAMFRLGGLNIGGGIKMINYTSPGRDPVSGLTLPGQDTIIFIILAGGGSL